VFFRLAPALRGEGIMRVVFFDTESTGLIDKNPDAEIVEYAGATWDDGEVTGEFHRFVLPKNGCPDEAAKINGFDEAKWRAACARQFCGDDVVNLSQRLDGMMLGGSNPDFDKKMIRAECARLKLAPPDWSYKHLDLGTFGLLLQLEGAIANAKLETLADYFGIPHEKHTAMGDVKASIKVWEACHERFLRQPRIMKQALVEIADQAASDGDTELEEYARNASEGIEG
jgi:DNA polymerase III epsilon subunit-like protein